MRVAEMKKPRTEAINYLSYIFQYEGGVISLSLS